MTSTRRLKLASRAERRAAARLDEARAQLARELLDAQGEGHTLRELAEVLDRSRASLHRLTQGGASS
jgi:hypothetical protein